MGRRRRSTTSASSSPPKKRRTRSSTSRALRDKLLGPDQSGRRLAVSDEDFNTRNKVLAADFVLADIQLEPSEVDFNVDANRKEHHTDEYEEETLIVRRGQAFDVNVTFNRAYNADTDSVTIQFTTGNRPQENKGTVIRLSLLEKDSGDFEEWRAVLNKTQNDDKELNISIIPSAEAIVGRYHMFIETSMLNDDGEKLLYRHEYEDDTVTVVFNPWCKDDQVYLGNEDERQEYVMNETGAIWCGSQHNFGGRPWNFGQFEDVCLEAALYLLDKAELADGARSNPVLICRVISAMANSMDDNGVLYGRWTEEWPKNCTLPWNWNGSVGIIEQYMKNKRSVRYGQCWVFSGLVTTLLRALGIPTRSVTNFESAHDTDASMTIDVHWGKNDEPIEDLNDSIWNFHVWNESWFRRPDLPEGYEGWQAHDATPQEVSEGVMRCGPAPLKAIKEGQVYLQYDAPFIFAEVNGDRVHWEVEEDGTMKPVYKEKDFVGRFISTKAVLSKERQDVTHLYKYPEGSEEERASVRRAHRYSSRRKHKVYDIPEPDVKFTLEVPNNAEIGKNFDLKVRMQNLVDEVRNVKLKLSSMVSFYTGVPAERIKTKEFNETVEGGSERVISLEIEAKDYINVLKPEASIQVYLRANVIENGRTFAKQDCFTLIKPTLIIQAPEKAVLREDFDVTVTFTNPLDVPLTGGEFVLEGAGILRPTTVHTKKSIAPGEEVSITKTMSSRKSGSRTIIVSFSSYELSEVEGTADVYVRYSA
ncbi:unnamed protein product [Owenia fusiformis]|uniref:Uncharacterized protein n=1 Tax=Owenia fusiformis TaxID=6347 RepID=A0A8J1Y852_OWEFU|nr:unnamed protein product [Owenia fusiformis]